MLKAPGDGGWPSFIVLVMAGAPEVGLYAISDGRGTVMNGSSREAERTIGLDPREPARLKEAGTTEAPHASLKVLLEAYERRLIQSALAVSAGNQRRAAAALGLLPTTLHEKMKRLGLLRSPLDAGEARPEIGSPS